MNLKEIRKEVYEYHRKYYEYLFKWPWYSYRRYKILFYIESASIMIFALLKTNITPNAVTLFYVGLGVLSTFLLALPSKLTVLLAVSIIFLKPAIDSVDGSLARLKGRASVSGDILDSYSAALDWVFLWTGLGIYLGNFTNPVFYFVAPVIPAIFAADIYANAHERFIYQYFKKKELRIAGKDLSEKPTSGGGLRLRKIKNLVDTVFQHNARTVDLICLMAAAEMCAPIRILWVFYLAFMSWKVLSFAARLYMVAFKRWGETELGELQRTLYG